jgi:cytidylate kinase
MKITVSGRPGSGKSTVAKELAEKLGLRHFSSGQFQRDLAKEKGVSPLELAKMAEKDPEIDKKTDSWVETIGEADDHFVMDSRLGFNFIPDSIKVFLDVTDDEAARRVFHDLRPEEKENISQGATYEGIKKREESEKKRYQEYYGIDYTDPDNYDLVIDTTSITAAQAVRKIIDFLKKRGEIITPEDKNASQEK